MKKSIRDKSPRISERSKISAYFQTIKDEVPV